MPVFALTIFIGAFLLFQVQPLIGKYILPWFGDGTGIWTACLLFFQALLARDQEALDSPGIQSASRPARAGLANVPLWTDDFSSLFQVLK